MCPAQARWYVGVPIYMYDMVGLGGEVYVSSVVH